MTACIVGTDTTYVVSSMDIAVRKSKVLNPATVANNSKKTFVNLIIIDIESINGVTISLKGS